MMDVSDTPVALEQLWQTRPFGEPTAPSLQGGMNGSPSFSWRWSNEAGAMGGPPFVAAVIGIRPSKDCFDTEWK